MNPKDKDKLDVLIEKEKRAYAREYFREIWESAVDEGIDEEILAEALVEGALDELFIRFGAGEASKLIAQLKQMDELGLFPAGKTLQ